MIQNSVSRRGSATSCEILKHDAFHQSLNLNGQKKKKKKCVRYQLPKITQNQNICTISCCLGC